MNINTMSNMNTNLKLIFVSNYLNHHQIPFCDALYERLNGDFAFIQTIPMEKERVQMGWNNEIDKPYLKKYYEMPEECRTLIQKSHVVLFGGTDDESYISDRLKSGKTVIRYEERLYKSGQWKAVSPRGLVKKYKDHVRYRNSNVYLLCAGGYVASDYGIIHAYPGKMFCWGYFPETKIYDVDKLIRDKGCRGEPKKVSLLWSGRFLDWKHPELAVETAAFLKKTGISFHLNMIGGGEMASEIRDMIHTGNLDSDITLKGFLPPAEVREYMEKADIYLFTSDRKEGWGAVANESMNSGCALIADHMIGAVPYLIRHEQNGLIYRDGDKQMLFDYARKLAQNQEMRQTLGRNAYETIVKNWNAQNAAKTLLSLIEEIESNTLKRHSRRTENPCPGAPEMPLSERKMYSFLTSC